MRLAHLALFTIGLSCACLPGATAVTEASAAEPAALGAPAPASPSPIPTVRPFRCRTSRARWSPSSGSTPTAHSSCRHTRAVPSRRCPRPGPTRVWSGSPSTPTQKASRGTARSATPRQRRSTPFLVRCSSTKMEPWVRMGVKTTPHMYRVDPAGNLVYRGGLDNAPPGGAPKSGLIPFFENALTAVTAGEAVKTADTKAYGCSVKYGSRFVPGHSALDANPRRRCRQ